MKQIPVQVKYFETGLPQLGYQSEGAAAFDFYTRQNMTLAPRQVTLVPTGVALAYPKDYWLLVAARSSLQKLHLQLINGVGVVDADYCGDEDEIRLLIYNFGEQTVTIKKGERLAQGILIARTQAKFTSVGKLDNPNRGGIGSTGK
ncbi:MAG: dUTP diphosphatase [bacterium]|nr:dUTP diphosphatase [bacterium]